MSDNDSDLDQQKQLLLVAALPYSADPEQVTANSFRVLKRAMTLSGVWTNEMEAAGHGVPNGVFDAWYARLIEMARKPFRGEFLFRGHGNLALPAAAHFTACYLTPPGRTIAETLLLANPKWRT